MGVQVALYIFLHRQGRKLIDAAAALETHGPLDDFRGSRHIAQPHPRSHDLGKGTHIQHPPAVAVQGMERSYLLSLEAQVDVAVILQHRHAVAGGNFQSLDPPLPGHRPAQGILKDRDGVEELYFLALGGQVGKSRFQSLRDDALRVAFDAADISPEPAHRPQSPQIDIFLGQQHIPRIGQRANQHGDRLAGAGSKHQILRADDHLPILGQLFGQPLPQGGQAGGNGIEGQIPPFPFQGDPQGIGQAGQRQGIRVRIGHGKIVLGVAVFAAGNSYRVAGIEAIIVKGMVGHTGASCCWDTGLTDGQQFRVVPGNRISGYSVKRRDKSRN